jgi:transcriptional regulator with XRE-family HTH domain
MLSIKIAEGVCFAMPPVKKPPHSRGATYMRQWRKFKKLTQEQAAERCDVDRTTLGRIEKGELPYNQDFLEKLALAYGVDVIDILTVDPLVPDPPRLVYDRLRKASKEKQQQAMLILDALLRDAS